MERQRQVQRPAGSGGGPELVDGEGVEQVRATMEGILEEADRILDSLRPVNAEDYLQRNRQRGGE